MDADPLPQWDSRYYPTLFVKKVNSRVCNSEFGLFHWYDSLNISLHRRIKQWDNNLILRCKIPI